MSLSLQSAAAVVRRDARPHHPDAKLDAYHREMLVPFGIEISPLFETASALEHGAHRGGSAFGSKAESR